MNHHRFQFQRPGSLRTNAVRIPLVAAVTMTTQLLGLAQSARDSRGKTWHQPAGPHGNWKVEGTPPIEWSVVRDENILWRTSMPECGESNVTIWADRAFTTIHKPLKSIDEKNRAKDIVGYCLNADDGTVLWTVDLPGSAPISINGGFSDGTVFGPITDGKYVWFFNRCGSMGCYDFEGKQIWFREFTPRYKHNNRQFELLLVGDALLNVEVLNKELGSKIQKWKPDGVTKNKIEVPTDPVQQKQVWCYSARPVRTPPSRELRLSLGSTPHRRALYLTHCHKRSCVGHAAFQRPATKSAL